MKIIKPQANTQIFIENFGEVKNKAKTIDVLLKLADSVEKMSQANAIDRKVAEKVRQASDESQKSGNTEIVVKRLSEAQTLLNGVGTATKLLGDIVAVSELVRKFF
jgi:hypothetical protein